jgi:hypothetical protein
MILCYLPVYDAYAGWQDMLDYMAGLLCCL